MEVPFFEASSFMNSNLMIALAAVASCGLLFYAFWSAGPERVKAPQAQTVKVKEVIKPDPVASSAQSKSPATITTASQALTDGPLDAVAKQQLLEAIHLASISCDQVVLDHTQPHLARPEPELREPALNGVVVLGHAQGAPLLREAARRLTDSKEIARLQEKADWLELPSVPPAVIKARFGQKSGAGTPAPSQGQ